MKVLFLPDWQDNPYQTLLADSLRASGCEVGFSDFPEGEFSLNAVVTRSPGVNLLHLHWVHPYFERVLWAGSSGKSLIRIMLLMLDILVARLRGVRVIWTVHNLVSHESRAPQREILARRWTAHSVSHLIFHSVGARDRVEALLGISLSSKSSVIPHGHYIDSYLPDPDRAEALREKFELSESDRVVLFFGSIRPYKGVLQLIEAMSGIDEDSLKLVIAGNPLNDELRNEIEFKAKKDPRIKLMLGVIPVEDVNPIFEISDVLAVPFERVLTSGSAILGLSMGIALLLPQVARETILPDMGGALFFDSPDSLRAILRDTDTATFRRLGRHNLTVAKTLDWNSIAGLTLDAYRLGKTIERRS